MFNFINKNEESQSQRVGKRRSGESSEVKKMKFKQAFRLNKEVRV